MSVFVLGVWIDNVIETAPQAAPPPGRQRIDWAGIPAWTPGGNLFLKILPKQSDSDIEPTNVYAFYLPQDRVPPLSERTTNFFFGLANQTDIPNFSASVHAATADANGNLHLNVPGVLPSLTGYFVQTIIEYPA
jgi:hypothetical protein